MYHKIKQLKTAMKNILQQLRKEDLFHFVEFNNDINVWNLHGSGSNVRFPKNAMDNVLEKYFRIQVYKSTKKFNNI